MASGEHGSRQPVRSADPQPVKQRTEAARWSERELRDVVNTVPAHVWSTSPEGEVDFVKIVDAPFGKRPFRVHVDPTQDGAEVVNMVCDRVRAELLRRIGLTDVLTPRQLV